MSNENTSPKRVVGQVTAGAGAGTSIAGAVTTVVVYIYTVLTGHELPDHVVAAVTTIIATAGALYGGYLVPPRPHADIPDGTGRHRKEL